jgi:hypothetical protein
VMLLFEHPDSLELPPPTIPLPRNRSTRAHAHLKLAEALRTDQFPSGIWQGREATTLARQRVIPALDRILKSTVGAWSPDSLKVVATKLNEAHAQRRQSQIAIEQALSAPWGRTWRLHALGQPDPATVTRPLELLIETLLCGCAQGKISPDRFDIASATDICELALQTGFAVATSERRLADLTLAARDGQVLIFDPRSMEQQSEAGADSLSAHADFDAVAYVDASRRERLRLRPQVELPTAHEDPDSRTKQHFIRIATIVARDDAPKSLLKVDANIRTLLGTGFDGINAILGTAVTSSSPDGQVATTKYRDLLTAAQTWSGLPASEIRSALDLLTIDRAALKSEGLIYWELERRSQRLATRPLISDENDLLILPWLIRYTQDVYSQYFFDGRLPWPIGAQHGELLDSLAKYRQVANRQLERDAKNVARSLKIPCRANVLPEEAKPFGIDLPGEIDLLIADVTARRIWVCEVKDVSPAFSPRALDKTIRRFREDDLYLEKLSLKVRAIQNHTTEAATLLGLPEPIPACRVETLVVTRRIEPIGFCSSTQTPFVVLADLAELLASPLDPGPGYFETSNA